MITKFSALALATLPLLAACSGIIPQVESPPPAESSDAYVARGNEPGWMLTMNDTIIDYQGDYGETRISVPKVAGVPSFNGMRYATQRLTVDVTYASCTDDMSGKRFTDTVTVMADGQQVKGCGGRALPPETLEGTAWKILSLDDMPIAESEKPAELRFTDGKISGSAGCNSLSGSYTAEGSALQFGPIIATQRMCPEPQRGQENKLFAILKGKVSTRYSVDGDLIITGADGSRVTLRQLF